MRVCKYTYNIHTQAREGELLLKFTCLQSHTENMNRKFRGSEMVAVFSLERNNAIVGLQVLNIRYHC